jgi:membrane protease YdiL (CAAX protease family)
MGNPHVERLSPHTRSELSWWVAVSLSAGFCEEFIFRGYLIWAFQPVLGLWGAAGFSVVVFAAAHAYQGAKGILATGVVGSLLTLVVLISGSLWPAIALHALTDIGAGLVAWLAFRKVQGAGGMITGLTESA